MNKKKFWKTFLTSFGISILVLVIFVGVLLGVKFKSNLGGGHDIAELDKVLPDGRQNVVVFGTDGSGLHADVIMIFSISQKDNNINVISVPRDTKVRPEKYGTHKITETLNFGNDVGVIVTSIKEATGIPIHDYVVVNFKAVEEIVDALDGVEFDVPQNMRYSDPEQNLYINLNKGYQLLNGNQALQLMRFRSYPMGDIQRTKVQRDFMTALFKQKANIKYFSKIGDLYNAVEKNIESSMSYSEILSYATKIQKMQNPEFNTFEMPYSLSDPYVIINKEKALKIAEENFQ